MIRSILGLVVCVIAMATLFAADEPGQDQPDPPVRLKKKKPNVAPGEQPVQEGLKPEDKKPDDSKAEEKKPEEKKPDDMGEITKDGEPIDSGEEDKEVFERVARNMKSVEERLVNKELNDGTRQIQEDIIKDLDSLINSGNPQGGGGGADQNQDNANEQPQGGDPMGQGQKKSGSQQKKSGKQKGKQGQKGQGQQKKNGTKGGNSKEQGKGNPQNQDGQGNKPMGQEKDQGGDNPGGNGNNGGKGGTSKEDPNRDADLYKDAWGHLPETLRAQMDAYSNREKYMDKHQDLIKQYYKSIAAQGQRKKE